MSSRLLSSLTLLASVLALSPACAQSAPEPCRYVKTGSLAIAFSQLRPTIVGKINGKDVTMLLDSGATTTNILKSAVEQLGLAEWHTNNVSLGVGGVSTTYKVRVDSIDIGPAHGQKVEFLVSEDLNMTYGAIVGADFLLQADLEVDLKDQQVKFFSPVGCEKAFLGYWDQNAQFIPAEDQEIAANDQVYGLVQKSDEIAEDHRQNVTVEINGQKIRAMIDSGAERSVIDLAAAARAGVTPASPGVMEFGAMGGIGTHNLTSWIAPFDSFTIGTEFIKNPKILIRDLWGASQADLNNPRMAAYIRSQPEMLLGADFLRAHHVLFARSQKRFYFTYTGGPVFRIDMAKAPPQDEAATFKMAQNAAEHNNASGMLNLGKMYALGQGVAQDRVQAYKWYRLAADGSWAQSHDDFRAQIGKAIEAITPEMTQEQIAQAVQLAKDWKPAPGP